MKSTDSTDSKDSTDSTDSFPMNMGIMGLFFFLSGLVHGIEIFHVA